MYRVLVVGTFSIAILLGVDQTRSFAGIATAREDGLQNPAPQPGGNPPQPANEVRAYTLTIAVTGESNSAQQVVKGAMVTLFAGDQEIRASTNSEGKATIRIRTSEKTAMLRIVADDWQSQEQRLTLQNAEQDLKVLMKPAD
jgi:hypothetical protein